MTRPAPAPAPAAAPLAVALALAAILAAAAPAGAQQADERPTPASVLAAAPASDWRAIDPADLLVMELAPGAGGAGRRIAIQLLPPPFSQGWVENIRTLARAHWWDGTSVYRVVDNWVAQWGAGEDEQGRALPLPAGLRVVPESEYVAAVQPGPQNGRDLVLTPRPEPVVVNRFLDAYALTGFVAGWPVGLDDEGGRTAWPVHCYGSVGVARDLSPDTGTGAELYAVIGHAPRQLDRNIAVVGRVIEGIEHLATLPRGTGEAGVYADPAQRVPIVSVRLGNELPATERPAFEYLATDSDSFARYLQLRANRSDSFYIAPAGGVDLCNAPVPVRRVAAG
ncbi:MAG: peptidylprolyl isomerase [Porphyrobacter sp.]|nr:peptidylprolyl isomerase [Porphyrobacter sp.]